jgi:Ca2+-transporting ATPase
VHFVRFQLTTSLAAVATILAARILDLPIPFSPIQILFVNIIADGPPAMSLGVDPPAPDVMKRKPLGRTEPILTNTRLRRILSTTAALMSAAIIWVLVRYRSADRAAGVDDGLHHVCVCAAGQLAHRPVRRPRGCSAATRFTNPALWLTIAAVSAMQVAVVEVPVLQRIFDTVGLTWAPVGPLPGGGRSVAGRRGGLDPGTTVDLA